MTAYRREDDRYAVILAGGDGTRLRSLTRAVIGDDRPKQFCPIFGEETLLDLTRTRVSKIVDPRSTMFSLTAKHRRFYERPLSSVSPRMKAVQPENRGTAPAILFCLTKLAKMDPNATVAFFPSDHFFGDDDNFTQHVEAAFSAAERDTSSVILLGIEPDSPETSYGWIEPAASLFGGVARSLSRVSRFWEKPDAGTAQRLIDSGCLWNSFVMVGKVAAFLEMFRQHLPEMHRMFASASREFGTPQEEAVIRSIYAWINEANFSSEVLSRAADRLMVMRVSDVDWSDLGEPQRVIETLNGLGLVPQWSHAIAA